MTQIKEHFRFPPLFYEGNIQYFTCTNIAHHSTLLQMPQKAAIKQAITFLKYAAADEASTVNVTTAVYQVSCGPVLIENHKLATPESVAG